MRGFRVTMPAGRRATKFAFAALALLLALLLASCGGGGGGGSSGNNGGGGGLTRFRLSVRDTWGAARTGEYVSNGVPLPKDLAVTDAAALHLEDVAGNTVPAQFEALSRWGGGLGDATKPIQWLLVTFRASVGADLSAEYFLAPGARAVTGPTLAVNQTSGGVTVDTGAAAFSLSASSFNVLAGAALSSAPASPLCAGGEATIALEGGEVMKALAPDSIVVEHAGPLTATVKLEGPFDNPPFAGVVWRYTARYTFFAGSPTAQLDFVYTFPGNKAGDTNFAAWDRSDLATVSRAVLTLNTVGSGDRETLAALNLGTTGLRDILPAGREAEVAQKLRPAMTAPAYSEATLGDAKLQGGFAGKPALGVLTDAGWLGASLQKMKFYEPQALSYESGKLTIELVADTQRLGPFMGGFARAALTVGAATADPVDLFGKPLARLDRPLFAWPDRTEVARGGVLDELWDGSADADSAKYLAQLETLSDRTLAAIPALGMQGFMTYGLVPRYWDPDPNGYSEFGDTSVWDGYFFEATFTDYHNAFGSVLRQFAQTADPKLLDGLCFPAARRMLNTQIIQGPADFFYSGWSPIAYGGYRKDGNSSHSYFDNLYNYYYLTGDRRVLDVLKPAGESLRAVTTRDGAKALIPSGLPTAVDWVGTVDRASSQQAAIFWFLGHASTDATFLDDFRNQLERGVKLNSALVTKDGKEYAFTWERPTDKPTAESATTTQLWMLNLYYLENLWCLYKEYGDVELAPGVRISRYFAGHERAMWDFNSKVGVGGDGTPAGQWATVLDVAWTGPALGGELQSAVIALDPQKAPEPYLWFSGKSTLPAAMHRAARLNADTGARSRAVALTRYLLSSADISGLGWGKEAGIRYARMHPAAAYLAQGINAGQ